MVFEYDNKLLQKLVILSSLLFLTYPCYSQSALPKKAKMVTAEYKLANYIAKGYVYKKEFVENQALTFISSTSNDTILSGTYFKKGSTSFIRGVWIKNTTKGKTSVNGYFEVSNRSDGVGLTTNNRKGVDLAIKLKEFYLYKGFRANYPATLTRHPNNSYILTVYYNDRKKADDLIRLEITISNGKIDKYGYFAIDDLVMNTNDVKHYYYDGRVFIGKIEHTVIAEDGLSSFIHKEGKFIHAKGEIDTEELSLLPDSNYKYQIEYSNNRQNNAFSKLELIVDKKLIEKYGFWAGNEYILNIPNVIYKYKNGNVFSGKVETIKDTISQGTTSQLTVGILKYKSGETFQGDLSGQWYCGIPISGKMTFPYEDDEEGNWLAKYHLSEEQIKDIFEIYSPTKKLRVARNFHRENQYQSAYHKAELEFLRERYKSAKRWYLEAKSIYVETDESKYIDSQLSKIEFIVAEIEKDPTFEYDANGIEMVFVKGGTFQMGSNDGYDSEKPIHTVSLDDYYIGKYEVTQKQWETIIGNNPSYFKGDNLPVETVNWNDVQWFIKKLNQKTGKNYRLPTEAEWEYAARGGNQSKGCKYSGSNTIDDVAWYHSYESKTHTVGTKQANELGIYDMSGNVWEWCSDWYGDYGYPRQDNPQGSSSGTSRVYRGGTWYLDGDFCRISNRRANDPSIRYSTVGFRLVLSSL